MRFWIILLGIACTGDKDPPPDSDADADADSDSDSDTDADTDTDVDTFTPGTVPLAGPCPEGSHVGGFSVESDSLFAVVGGAVTDGVVPASIRTLVSSEGDCVLLRNENPFCDPACAPLETCDFDGSCVPYPREQSVGTVTVEGLTEAVEMDPNPPGASYYALGLTPPPYVPGGLITLTSSGGVHPAFTLHGVGVEPFTSTPDLLFIQAATDLAVSWSPPSEGARSVVHLHINIDQHGTTPLALECTFEDSGQGTIPGALIDAFIAAGVTGIPSARLLRRTVDSVELDVGCVDFDVAWAEVPEVDVDGFTPCQSPEDCPSGEVCNTTLEICEPAP